MAPASTRTAVAHIYKRRYSGKRPLVLALRDHPLYSMITKIPESFGDGFYYPVSYSNTQGIGGTLSGAQTGVTASKGVKFAMQPAVKYGYITIDGVSMLRSKGNMASFVQLFTNEADSIMIQHGDDCAFDLYRDTSCKRGQRASISTNVVQLATVDDARNFFVNMTVSAGPNADGSSLRTGTTTVTKVNLTDGQITLASAAAITSFSDNDYLFRSTTEGTGVEGLEDLFPLTAPGASDSFRGINRSVYPELLSGARTTAAGRIEENIGNIAVEIHTTGRKADSAFVNPRRFWNISRRLDAKVQYSGGGGKATIGFEFIELQTPGGRIKLYSDPDCPMDRARVQKLKDLRLAHAAPPVHVVMDDGLRSIRLSSDDGIELRTRSVGNLYALDTGAHGVAQIA